MEKPRSNPRVSVVTVCYNAEIDIERTIQSVLSQQNSSLEYIVIDGGSKDGTVGIIKKYLDRIAFFVSEPDKGIYDAMNKGLGHSHGEWINFMNAGDVFYNDHVIENIMACGPFDNQVKVLYGNVYMVFSGHEGFVKKLDQVKKDSVPFSLNHQSTLIDGGWMREMGYDTSYRIAADANFFNETAKAGFAFQYVPVTVSSYESSEGVSAVNQMRLFQEMVKIRGIKKGSAPWIKGYVRARIFDLMHHFPFGLGERVLALYVKAKVG